MRETYEYRRRRLTHFTQSDAPSLVMVDLERRVKMPRVPGRHAKVEYHDGESWNSTIKGWLSD